MLVVLDGGHFRHDKVLFFGALVKLSSVRSATGVECHDTTNVAYCGGNFDRMCATTRVSCTSSLSSFSLNTRDCRRETYTAMSVSFFRCQCKEVGVQCERLMPDGCLQAVPFFFASSQ